MATKDLTVILTKEVPSLFRRPFTHKTQGDEVNIFTLKHMISKEKVRILQTLKHHPPSSIYDLAKHLQRNFVSVLKDIHELERFGIIQLSPEKSGKRKKLKPTLVLDALKITLQF